MNWSRDKLGFQQEDLDNVFKYDSGEATVIQIRESSNWTPQIDSLSNECWHSFVEHDIPIGSEDSGLVLLIAKRVGEPSLKGVRKATYEEWRENVESSEHGTTKSLRADAFAALAQRKDVDETKLVMPAPVARHSIRTVPFSRDAFEMIAENFRLHGSIARVISRADVPVFNFEEVALDQPAYVYNCRTSNAWKSDLALTVTHFPESRLTFAMLFGCSFAIEQDVISRLSQLRSEAVHPLILPGLFVELERVRHVNLVEDMGTQVETRIFELDSITADPYGILGSQEQQRNIDKRRFYLDFAYLKNGLVSWNRQLARLARIAQQLVGEDFSSDYHNHAFGKHSFNSRNELDGFSGERNELSQDKISIENLEPHNAELLPDMYNVSCKIRSRIMAIRDEYDDKIRDCAMRIEGMAMATQWAQGETNVEIALATNRDSRLMRSIALVTMIFLPGTFFASMFSMSFFNWSSNKDSPIVSTSLWIYFLITVFFTGLTIGLWWFIVIFRPSRLRKLNDEEDPEKFSMKANTKSKLKRWWRNIWQVRSI